MRSTAWPDPSAPAAAGTGLPLPATWRLAPGTGDGPPPEDADWLPATVPGTVAGALRAAGRPWARRDLDAETWWYRLRFPGPAAGAPAEDLTLCLDGLATVADVLLNGVPILHSTSMWRAHAVPVGGLLQPDNQLDIVLHALAPLLAQSRRPRQRWRTRIVPDGGLRWYRTTLLGRAPAFGAVPAPVGPWRPVRLTRTGGLAERALRVRAHLDGGDGVVTVDGALGAVPGPVRGVRLRLDGPTGRHEGPLAVGGPASAPAVRGTLRVPGVAPWWPHTHGTPHLYGVTLLAETDAGTLELPAGRAGFRTLEAGPGPGHRVEADGLDLHVNGVRTFVRGAVWTPPDPVTLNPAPEALRATVLAARDAGLNLLRVVGTMQYEPAAFHDLCDELGILVWQDLMFANLDYPFADPAFAAEAEAEAAATIGALAARASFAVLCGNSEIEQQAAMMGRDPTLGRPPFFAATVPALLAEAAADALYVPSAPCGGVRPFVPDAGVANWFGVGGYGDPVEQTRAAGVRFASECLAFANVPDDAVVAAVGVDGGVPRDAGADWDFADVRDRYLERRWGVDAERLREQDPLLHLELSRALTGELMAGVFGEWRRAASPCRGGIVLWWRDLEPGSGWGLLDHRGVPKAAYHHLRRALAPVALWLVDEGLSGLRIHVANDRPQALRASVTLARYRDGEHALDHAAQPVLVPAHSVAELDAETLLGGFVDVGYRYRFGPPAHDLVVVRLLDDGGAVLAQVCRAIGPQRPARSTAAALGLRAAAAPLPGGGRAVALAARRHVQGLRLHVRGLRPEDDAFDLAPGEERTVALHPEPGAAVTKARAHVTALNLRGRMAIAPAGAGEARA